MRFEPIYKYRPVRTPDAEGGFTETYPTPRLLYVFSSYHDGQLSVTCDSLSDVLIGDVLKLDAKYPAYYRVTSMNQTSGERYKQLVLERIEAPVNPHVP